MTEETNISTKKVDNIEGLRELYSDLQVLSAEATLAKAKLDLFVAKVYKEHDINHESHALCLWCGKFVLRSAGCKCQKGGKDITKDG